MEEERVVEHLNPTEELSLDTVKKRAVKGVAVLTGRTFILSAISLIATGFLTFFLTPAEFGIFWIVSAIVNFLAYFSDIGLAAALIQKKEKITNVDLKTTFTVQQCLVISVLLILFLLTPFFQKFYSLSPDGKLLLYSLGLSLFLSSLKTIPSILLERELEFPKLVIPQVLENLVYNLVAVFLAWQGLGIRSLTYAVLIRGIVGLIAIYILKPWKPGISFSRNSLKGLLRFGAPYQANTFLAMIKDDGMTAFLRGMLGAGGIGLLGWAQKWAYTPLRLFMDHVLKVTFPAFSRMQDNREALKRSITRSIFFVCFLVFPTTAGLLITAPLLVKIIPRYEKWEPALLPLMLISVNTFFAASTSQLTNLLNAIGKIKTTFKLMLMWTILTWMLVPTLARVSGVNGAALGYSLVGASSLVAIYISHKIIDFSIREAIINPLVSTLLMSFVLIAIRQFLTVNLYSVVILVVVGIIIYIFSSLVIVGSGIVADAKRGFSSMLK